MQWDESPNAGFTTATTTPWLPLAEDYRTVNVAAQRADPRSMLNFTRRLIELRRGEAALTIGAYEPAELRSSSSDVIAYARRHGERRLVVVLNFSDQGQRLEDSDACRLQGSRVRLSTHMDREDERIGATLNVRRNEGVVLELE